MLDALPEAEDNFLDGEDVTREAGFDPDDVDMHEAFRLIQRRRTLDLDGWRGGMGLPASVGL